ncbi:MAG: hypothetical protein DRI34_06710 [Deltaproteobacteria bacterium]|nr:MAG: hypothetical protein DRI34_06710 [Deltaproteobacteria bacterium]
MISLLALLAACASSGTASDDGGLPGDGSSGGDGADDNAATFTMEQVASSGKFPSLAVAADGRVHVCYLDYSDNYLKYALRQDDGWSVTRLEYVADDNGTIADGGLCSIALDNSGAPHVCYYDYGKDQFRYAVKTATSWDIVSVPLPADPNSSSGGNFTPSFGRCSLAVGGSSGLAHLALGLWGTMGPALGYWRSDMTTAVVADADPQGNTGRHNSLALDDNGQPAMAYESGPEPSLKYAAWNGAGFTVEVVGPMDLVYWEQRLTAIFFDEQNHPHLGYYHGAFAHSYHDGNSWVTSTIPYQGGYPSLALAGEGAGGAYLSFVATDTGSLTMIELGHWNGQEWSFEVIDQDAGDVDACSLAVDGSGGIHLVYSQGSGDTVIKYAYR